jgi:activator-of-BECN1-regulated-autophagy protein 1
VDQCDPSISLHRGLASWAEADSLSNCTATYSELRPAPRSTIAAAFSPDGRTLASTHGDHTVKLIDCATGKCLATLAGHRRTPWVVRFHPSNPHVLASGSLDHEVRIWNARTSECILRFDFGKPIASLAFHPNGDILTVASGHKLYTWRYAAAMRSDWEARVNGDDTNAGDSAGGAEGADSNTAVNLGDRWTASPAYSGGFPSRSRGTVAGADVGAEGADPDAAALPYISLRTRRSLRAVHFHPHGVPLLLSAEVNDVNPARSGQSGTNEHEVPPLRAVTAPPAAGEWETAYAAASAAAAAAMGGGAANGSGIGLSDRSARGAQGIGTGRERSRTTYIAARSAPSSNPGSPVLSSQPSADADDLEEIARLRVRSPMEIDGAGGSTGVSRGNDSSTTRQQLFRAPGGDASASTAADQIQRDQPCTVKLKLWRYDRRNPLAPLSDARLVIPHAVLCSEMGAHFSPCGRLLAACVACLPKDAPEPVAGEPIPRLVYELRVYSLEEKNFGEVLAARSVRAAHCLTSIQFSPTSEHVLLAYGRRHSSLLLLIADGGSCITVHTILEVYRISDMSLVRVLPSAEDEVNVACFHPAAGGGLAYGTKEGRLRILRHDKPPPRNASKRPMAIGRCLEDELLEVLDWSGLDADADGLPVENSGSDTD